jgi:hypothetical protein
MSSELREGFDIAENFDVSTLKDCAVFYSISFLQTAKNRDLAYEYVKQHPNCKTLDHTPCGKTLCEKGYQSTDKETFEKYKLIWKTASERFVSAASGNITAFIEGADMRSTFCTVEIPNILANSKIKTINGVDKFEFLKKFIA